MTYTGQTDVTHAKAYAGDPQKGVTVEINETHKGETESLNAALAYLRQGYTFRLDPMENGFWKLRATSPSGNYGGNLSGSTSVVEDPNAKINDVWELHPNEVEKDWLTADIPFVNGLTNADKISGQEEAEKQSSNRSSLSSSAQQVFDLLRAGVKSVIESQPVLTHTITVKSTYSVAAALTNVGKIYSTTQLYSVESVPQVLLFNLPTFSNPTRTDSVVVKYGWRKGYPRVNQVAEGQYQIVQEFQYGLWADLLYTSVT